jgi:hypothetical protein
VTPEKRPHPELAEGRAPLRGRRRSRAGITITGASSALDASGHRCPRASPWILFRGICNATPISGRFPPKSAPGTLARSSGCRKCYSHAQIATVQRQLTAPARLPCPRGKCHGWKLGFPNGMRKQGGGSLGVGGRRRGEGVEQSGQSPISVHGLSHRGCRFAGFPAHAGCGSCLDEPNEPLTCPLRPSFTRCAG